MGSTFELVCVSVIYGVRINSRSNRFDRNINLCCHLYKEPTKPSSQSISLNHFAYLHVISHLAIDSCHQIYSGDHYNPNNITIDHVLSSRNCVNNYTYVTLPYSQIMNSRQDLNNLNSNVSSMQTNK